MNTLSLILLLILSVLALYILARGLIELIVILLKLLTYCLDKLINWENGHAISHPSKYRRNIHIFLGRLNNYLHN